MHINCNPNTEIKYISIIYLGSSLTEMVIEINVFIFVSKYALSYFILHGILMLQDFFGSDPDQNYLTDLC